MIDLVFQTYGLGGESFAILLTILAAASFMSGLSGFGFSAVGAVVLWIMPATHAVPLLMALSIASQLAASKGLGINATTLHRWLPDAPAPFIVGGLLGLPAGLWVLRELSANLLAAAFGAVLVAYSCWSMLAPKELKLKTSTPQASLAVGVVGGFIGGFTAFPGCAVVVWLGLTGLNKQRQRATLLPYILTMQAVALMLLGSAVDHDKPTLGLAFWILLASLVPLVIVFTRLGIAAFHRITDVDFRSVTIGLLGFSGAGLVAKGGVGILLPALWW
jgi:uncharacterized protein